MLAIVADFIENLRIDEIPEYVFMACTCGDETGFVHKQMSEILKKKGISLNAAFSVVMPETYINLPGFRLDPPEKAGRKISVARKKIPVFADDIKKRRDAVRMDIGTLPRTKSFS